MNGLPRLLFTDYFTSLFTCISENDSNLRVIFQIVTLQSEHTTELSRLQEKLADHTPSESEISDLNLELQHCMEENKSYP